MHISEARGEIGGYKVSTDGLANAWKVGGTLDFKESLKLRARATLAFAFHRVAAYETDLAGLQQMQERLHPPDPSLDSFMRRLMTHSEVTLTAVQDSSPTPIGGMQPAIDFAPQSAGG